MIQLKTIDIFAKLFFFGLELVEISGYRGILQPLQPNKASLFYFYAEMPLIILLLLYIGFVPAIGGKSNSTDVLVSHVEPSKYAPPADKTSTHTDYAKDQSISGHVDGLTWIYTSPEQWYSQHDLCIIKNWHVESNMTLAQVAKLKCHQDVLKDEWAGRLFVGYGSSYKATCSPPLTNRPQYMQALVGFNDPTSTHLLEAMRSINLLNRTLVFFGDTVMRQNYIALLAELRRLDKHIEIDRWASVKKMANKTTLPRAVNVFQRPNDDLEGGGATVWISQHHASKTRAKASAVYYISCHRLEQFDKAMALVNTVTSKAKGVVLIANMGLHYNDRSMAFKAMNVVLPALSRFATRADKKNTVLWRETTAQHYEFRSQGYFDHASANGRKEKHCVPHGIIKAVDRNDAIDWRNEDVKTILGINQITMLHYIPFYAATTSLFAMHPDKEKALPDKYQPGYSSSNGSINAQDKPEQSAFSPLVSVDCTQFCQTPTLWQPIWTALADIVRAELNHALGNLGAKEVDSPKGDLKSKAPSPSSLPHTKKPSHGEKHSNGTVVSGATKSPSKQEKAKSHAREHVAQFVKLNDSNRLIPIGPNFVLKVVNSAGAVVRNGIDIDKSAIVMKLPFNASVASIRSVATDDEGFQITRYEVRNRAGQVEGWISSHMRDKTHAKVVEILQFCLECVDKMDGL